MNKQEFDITKKYYEFLKALKAKLREKGNIPMIKFSKDEWKMPPQIVTVMKNMGWLEAYKNVQHKWVYSLNLEQIEPWHGETLKQNVRAYMRNSKARSENNPYEEEVSEDLEAMYEEDRMRLDLENIKKSNEETVKRISEKFKKPENSTLENFSDEEIVSELRRRGYELNEIWKKVSF